MDLISFDDAKKRLGKSDAELEEMRKRGEIRAFKDGPSWKFRKEDVDRLAGGEAGAGAPAGAPAEAKGSGDTLMSIDADILFAEEEEVPADSAAETWIAADTEGVFPKGQGGVAEAMAAPESELAPLALSPETDESSLGAVLSEEELAGVDGGEDAAIAAEGESGSAVAVPGGGVSGAPSRTRIVTLVEPPAHHEEFTFILAVGVVGLGLACVGILAVILGFVPGVVEAIGRGSAPLVLLGAGAFMVAVAAGVGYVLQKQRAAREAIGA